MTKRNAAKRVSENEESDSAGAPAPIFNERLKRRVQRHSPDRLLRRPVELPGGLVVSAEKHRGRLVVRLESPGEGRQR